jgi:hypothetical protein
MQLLHRFLSHFFSLFFRFSTLGSIITKQGFGSIFGMFSTKCFKFYLYLPITPMLPEKGWPLDSLKVHYSEGSLVRRSVSPNFLRSVSLVFRPKDRYRTVLNWFNIQSFIKLSKTLFFRFSTLGSIITKQGFGSIFGVFSTKCFKFYLYLPITHFFFC